MVCNYDNLWNYCSMLKTLYSEFLKYALPCTHYTAVHRHPCRISAAAPGSTSSMLHLARNGWNFFAILICEHTSVRVKKISKRGVFESFTIIDFTKNPKILKIGLQFMIFSLFQAKRTCLKIPKVLWVMLLIKYWWKIWNTFITNFFFVKQYWYLLWNRDN